jgi:hypothetical protein
VQADGDEHATLFKTPPAEEEWGAGTMLHRIPSQRSASVPKALNPDLSVEAPTAMQAEAEVHATPSKKLPAAPAGLGVGTMIQCVPFQRSANVTNVPESLR